MMPAFEFHDVARALTLRVVDSLAVGSAIGVFAAILLSFSRRQNAGARFAVWFSALMTIAAVPLVTGWMQPFLSSAGASIHRPAFTVADSWASGLLLIWAAIAAWNLFTLARALRHLHILRQTCSPLDPSVDSELQETLRRNRMHRPVLLCASQQVRVPTVIGLWKPMIIFPHWVISNLSFSELNQILLHELAHLRRRDDWTNLAQQLVKALFFFHPAVWWIEKKVSLEREIACDEAVVEATSSPRAYAECLARLAEMSFVRRSVALAQAVLGKVRHTSDRVARILDPRDSSNHGGNRSRNWKPAAALVATFALACCTWTSRQPKWIAFQENANPTDVAAHSLSARPSASHALAQNLTATPPSSDGAYIVPAKYVPASAPSTKTGPALVDAATIRSTAGQPKMKSIVPYRLVEFTGTGSEFLVFTDAVFVVIHNDENVSTEPPPAHIEMWHLLVLHSAAGQDSKIPPKKT
jgi:beta-lactamase regulating signal transducer with metallopeptidase domain